MSRPLLTQEANRPAADEQNPFVRLWQGFMTGRLMLALAVLLFELGDHLLGTPKPGWVLALCAGYFLQTLSVRVFSSPVRPGEAFRHQWFLTVAVDLVVFTILQVTRVGGLTYLPLFVLPALLAGVMGTRIMALGTAALITLTLLTEPFAGLPVGQLPYSSELMQAALSAEP